MKDLAREIKAYALKNAIDFGKADAGRILPKLFQHGLKKDEIKIVLPIVQKIVKEINSLSISDKKGEFEKFKNFVHEKIEEEKKLSELDKSGREMVFRLAPFPSGAMHLGNAKTYLLNALYAEKYGARVLLVMDDTIGSEEKQAVPEAYQLIEDAFEWLNVKYEKPVVYKSDRLDIYYSYGEKLIEKDKAYVCTCKQEKLRKNREEGKECECRNLKRDEQKKRWKAMFKGKEGSAVVRIKTSMQDKNPAFRDRVLFKISERAHPRVGKKYRVWPTLEMSWAIDDHLLGVTHILRGNDLAMESDMEKLIWNIFGWKHPTIIHTGLVNIEDMGAKLSKSKAQKEVKSGKFIGWDDPRTWSIQSLQRRGFRPEAIRDFIEEIGLNRQDITIPIESLYAINRKIIDAETERHYFVEGPIRIEVKDAPALLKVEVPMHPDRPKNVRIMRVAVGDIYISNRDYRALQGKEVRLLHLYNIKLGKGKKAIFTSHENKKIPKIQWVSFGIPTRILMHDGKWAEGLADENIIGLREGEVVQFERVGFARFDRAHKGAYEFWYAHP